MYPTRWNLEPATLNIALALILIPCLGSLGSGCAGGDKDDTGVEDVDADGDGFNASVDCDDNDPTVYPGADELCDGKDNDCNGTVDDDYAVDAPTWYIDYDGDGYGSEELTRTSCAQPDQYVDNADDCDDRDADVYPGAVEYCDGKDNDCNGLVDDDPVDEGTWYEDKDGDGYGDPSVSVVQCEPPAGFVEDGTDCDDSNPAIHPGADEYCDGVDNDCNGTADDDYSVDAPTWYEDADGDGFGAAASSRRQCYQPDGYVLDDTDCDDSDGDTYPGADEYCDGVDNDCNGTADDDYAVDAPTWYEDADGDGYGNAEVTTVQCYASTGWVADATDCDDDDATVNPGATEYDDDIDNNCNEMVDEGYREYGDLTITEIMYNPSGSEPGTEWFEIYNPSSTRTYDLAGFQIYSSSATGRSFYVPADTLTIPPESYLVFCHGDSDLGGLCDYVYGSDVNPSSSVGNTYQSVFTLGNTGPVTLQIALGATAVDEVTYGTTISAGWPTSANGWAIALDPTYLDAWSNEDGGNWCYPSSTYGTLGDYGTPGSQNDVCVTF